MEVITIESKAFQEITRKFDQILDLIQYMPQAKPKEEDKWMDSKSVCQMLNISTRTLYRMKKEKQISYSILRGRCLFKRSDIEQALGCRSVATHPDTLEELRQNYSVQNNKHL